MPLADRVARLDSVMFQKDLGTTGDKRRRLEQTAAAIATKIGGNPEWAARAAQLAKADLVTDMVGEFDDLQGTMGRDYALNDGEPEEVAEALFEQYLPRFAGDQVPETGTGTTLALADRLALPEGEWRPFKPPIWMKPLFHNWYPDWLVHGNENPLEAPG